MYCCVSAAAWGRALSHISKQSFSFILLFLKLLNRYPVVRRNSIIVPELALVPGARTEMDTRFGKQVKVMKSIVFLENLDSHHAAATRVTMQ